MPSPPRRSTIARVRQVHWIAAVAVVFAVALTVALTLRKPAVHPPRRPAAFERARGGTPIVISPDFLKLSDVDEPPPSAAGGPSKPRAFASGMVAYANADYAE